MKWRPSIIMDLVYSGELSNGSGPGFSSALIYPLNRRISLEGNVHYAKYNSKPKTTIINPSGLASVSLKDIGAMKIIIGAGLGYHIADQGNSEQSKSMLVVVSNKYNYYFTRRWGVSILGEFRQPIAKFEGNLPESFWAFGLGLFISFYGDKDRDGIPNDEDVCIYTPRGAKVNKRGCGIDSDGDGVYDGVDKCEETPYAAIVDKFGCPMDSDNDGIFDGVDLCEGTPEGINVDSIGCPGDTDEDGIPDFKDSCNATPSGAIVNKWGCPSDSDQDGIFDGIDECQNTPTGFEVDQYGCPAVKPVSKEIITGLFDNNLNINGKAAQQLEIVAERIYAYPSTKYQVNIYTDTEGSAIYNLNRSNAIAAKVKQFLVDKGVKESQVEIKGFGKSNPLLLGFSEKAKIKNRRVEIIRITNNTEGEINENN